MESEKEPTEKQDDVLNKAAEIIARIFVEQLDAASKAPKNHDKSGEQR